MNIQTSLPQCVVALDAKQSTLGFNDLQLVHIARGKALVLHPENNAFPDIDVVLSGMVLHEEPSKVADGDPDKVRSDRRWMLFGWQKNEPGKHVNILWENHKMISFVWSNV